MYHTSVSIIPEGFKLAFHNVCVLALEGIGLRNAHPVTQRADGAVVVLVKGIFTAKGFLNQILLTFSWLELNLYSSSLI
jgi:hypothetical protein